jgi:hypothetical protein
MDDPHRTVKDREGKEAPARVVEEQRDAYRLATGKEAPDDPNAQVDLRHERVLDRGTMT